MTSDQSIAETCFVDDTVAVGAKLFTQPCDVHIHRAFTHISIIWPHGRKDFLSCKELARLLPEEVEDELLASSQTN